MLTNFIDFILRAVQAVAAVSLCIAVMGFYVGIEVLRYKDAQRKENAK